MKLRLFATGVTVAALAPMLTACGGEEASAVSADCEPVAQVKTVNPGKLTALIVEYPPYISLQGGDLTGPDGELINRVADAPCLEVDASLGSVTAVVEGLKAGRADISANDWYRNEERAQLFEVTDPVYSDNIAVISADGYKSIDELEGATVGMPSGVLWTEDLQAALGTDSVSIYPTEAAVIDDLIAGRLDAGLTGEATAVQRLGGTDNDELQVEVLQPDERIEASLSPAVSVALVQKGNTALRDLVNEVLSEYRSSGDLGAALESVGMSAEGANVTAE